MPLAKRAAENFAPKTSEHICVNIPEIWGEIEQKIIIFRFNHSIHPMGKLLQRDDSSETMIDTSQTLYTSGRTIA